MTSTSNLLGSCTICHKKNRPSSWLVLTVQSIRQPAIIIIMNSKFATQLILST